MTSDRSISSNLNDIPPVPDALITALEKRFPDTCPDLTDSEREIFFKAGAVSVIKLLKRANEMKRTKTSPMEMTVDVRPIQSI